MGLNWKLVLGKALGTMADQETEYRKFATDYFLKRHQARMDEVKDARIKRRDQKKTLDQKVDLLRGEGLTDTQIANGINTYGENFFAVVAEDLKAYKASKNYEFSLSQDPTGNKYRQEYSKRFDNLLVTPTQRKLELEPVVSGLLDKLPDMMETPEIAQSMFGFDYTKGLRESTEKLGSDMGIPDYDAPARLQGVSTLLSGTIKPVPEQQTYTRTGLDQQIIKRLQVKYGDFKLNVDSTRFETQGEKDQKKLDKIRQANTEAVNIQRKFNSERSKTPPGSMEGGLSDQQLLDKIMGELGYDTSVIAVDDADATGAEAAMAALDGTQVAVDGDATGYTSNLTTHTQKFPDSTISKIVKELQNQGADVDTINSVLQSIAGGNSARSALSGANIRGRQARPIIEMIKDLSADDIDVLKGFGTASSGAAPDQQPQVATSNKFVVDARPQDPEEAKLWDSIFGPYFAPDGNVIESAIQEYAIGNAFVKQKIDEYKQRLLGLEVEKEQRSMDIRGA